MNGAERDILVRGIAAAKANSRKEARFFLEKLLGLDPPSDARVQAWWYLSEISDDPAQKREYISRILAVDGTHGPARRALAVLDGRLDPAAIVSPDGVRQGPHPTSRHDAAERLSCPRCGSGRLVAQSVKRRLVCEHCGYEELIPTGAHDESVDGHDVAAAIWTVKGHRAVEQRRSLMCAACRATLLPPPDLEALTCPFCGSVHVTAEPTPPDRIAPEALVPFRVTQQNVIDLIRSSKEHTSTAASPVYLPIWMFTFAGEVRWSGYEADRDGRQSEVKVTGAHPLLGESAMARGTPRLPREYEPLVDSFDLTALVPYDPRQLAGHVAAGYQITLDAASLEARKKVVEALRSEVQEEHADLHGLEMSFARVDVDSFKLLLLPFWIVRIDQREVFINGQTGAVADDEPPGLLSWIRGLWRGTD